MNSKHHAINIVKSTTLATVHLHLTQEGALRFKVKFSMNGTFDCLVLTDAYSLNLLFTNITGIYL